MGHHQHVFMWDSTPQGVKGAIGIVNSVGHDSSVIVKIRMPDLTEYKWFRPTTLKGDNPGGLGGASENGAWAYKGNIPRQYLFIEGLDTAARPGFTDWQAGKGWPTNSA